MNDKETIKNKFLSFEPEVDDIVINQKWEKIKYFVPQKEKKKRGMIFFLYGSLALLIMSSLIMFIPSLTPTSLNTASKQTNIKQKTKIADEPEVIISKFTDDTKSVSENKNKNDLKKANDENNSSQKFIANNTSALGSKKDVSIIHADKKIAIVSSQPSFTQTQNSFNKDEVIYDHLPLLPFQILIPEKNAEITSEINPNYYLPKPVSPLSVDLLVGIQALSTSIKQTNADQKNNTLNYMAGVALNYHFRNKFSFTGQFIFSKNNFNYKNTVTENKIINKPVSVSTMPTAYGDTVKYMLANTNYIIRSNNTYNFAAGAEYKILQKNKLNLSVFALLNVCATKYTYGYTRDYGKDILLHIKGDPAPHPSASLVSSTFKEGDYIKEETKINTGIMPGLLLGYRLNNKTSLIFKPAYFIPFSENKMVINSSTFSLKENSLLINVGLRIAL